MADFWAFLQHFTMVIHAHPGFWLGIAILLLSLILIRVIRTSV
jgi:hypothetical protein